MASNTAAALYKHANSIVRAKIGLEVHAQLNIRSKLFSRGNSSGQERSNSSLDLFDIALPGTLPKLNRQAIDSAILSSLGLNCKLQNVIHFDRKNYFYADMPAGYQITQYNNPIAKDGYIDFIVKAHHKSVISHSQRYDVINYLYHDEKYLVDVVQPYIKRSVIKQIQLEQDSAKTLLYESTTDSLNNRELCHLVDYNRSGIALIEIVFEPDLTNHFEATSLVKELISILKLLNTCDCELQDGSLRVDANVSIDNFAEKDIDAARVELKNLNSLKALSRGIHREINRQIKVISEGKSVVQETRTYDSKSDDTIMLRIKEDAVDYRYVPEPSIPPISLDSSLVKNIEKKLPKRMPSDVRHNLIDMFGIDMSLVVELMNEPGLSDYLSDIMDNKLASYDPNVVADFLIYTIANLKDIPSSPTEVDLLDKKSEFLVRLSPIKMQHILDMLFKDEISFGTGYEVIKYIFTNNDCSEPRDIVQKFDWFQINDKELIKEHCEKLVIGMKNISKQYRKKGDKKYIRMMLQKLSELTDNRISVKLAIETLNQLLRTPK